MSNRAEKIAIGIGTSLFAGLVFYLLSKDGSGITTTVLGGNSTPQGLSGAGVPSVAAYPNASLPLSFNLPQTPTYLTYNFPPTTYQQVAPLQPANSGNGGSCCDECAGTAPSQIVSQATQVASVSPDAVSAALANLNSVGAVPTPPLSNIRTAPLGSVITM